ncbi:hypothetical protein FKP32DRAFT_1589804 [Trametes sanguinea]|nr:hypothetical protein FKP32DRAFT_1589804 [Trametes sanguinea]
MDAIIIRVLRSVTLPQAKLGGVQSMSTARKVPPLRRLMHSDGRRPPPNQFPTTVVADRPIMDVGVRTFDSEKLSPDDYVDLSDRRVILYDRAFEPESSTEAEPGSTDPPPSPERAHGKPYKLQRGQPVWSKAFLSYACRRRFSKTRLTLHYLNFPTNARGFFYYHEHPKFVGAGSIRFRVTQNSNPQSFSHGVDLLTEDGLPWRLSLAAVLGSRRYQTVQRILARDNFLDYETEANVALLLQKLTLMMGYEIGASSQLVYEPFEPFSVDLRDPTQTIYIMGNQGVFPLFTNDFFVRLPFSRAEMHLARSHWPFEQGRLTCCLVPLNKRQTVAVRVERIIEPVRVRPDVLEGIRLVDELQPRRFVTMEGVSQKVFDGKPYPGAMSVQQSLLRRNEVRMNRRRNVRDTSGEAANGL